MTLEAGWRSAGRLEPEGCGYCGMVKPVTTVYGSPLWDLITVVDAAGCRCCAGCTPVAIRLATIEVDFSGPAVRVVPIDKVVQL